MCYYNDNTTTVDCTVYTAEHICIHGCRLEIIYNIIVTIKLDQRDFISGCALIESYLKKTILD